MQPIDFLLARYLARRVFSAQETPEIEVDEVVPGGIETIDWVTAAIVLVIAVALAWGTRQLVTRALCSRDVAVGIARLIGRFFAAAVFLAGLVYVLASLGIRIGPLLGALGIVGIALAFALQDILENFVAGILLQTRRPFAIGDQVSTNEFEGTVEDVNTRVVVLKTFDGERILIPSAMVLKNPIHNSTAFEQRRTTVVVGVSYDADLHETREVLLDAVKGVPGVLDRPEPEAYLEELDASSVNFAVRFWHAPTIAEFWAVRDGVIEATFDALGTAGIEIPFPQRTIHIPDASDTVPAGD